MAANARFGLENGQGNGPFRDGSTLGLPGNDEPTTETGIFDHLVSQELQGGRGKMAKATEDYAHSGTTQIRIYLSKPSCSADGRRLLLAVICKLTRHASILGNQIKEFGVGHVLGLAVGTDAVKRTRRPLPSTTTTGTSPTHPHLTVQHIQPKVRYLGNRLVATLQRCAQEKRLEDAGLEILHQLKFAASLDFKSLEAMQRQASQPTRKGHTRRLQHTFNSARVPS